MDDDNSIFHDFPFPFVLDYCCTYILKHHAITLYTLFSLASPVSDAQPPTSSPPMGPPPSWAGNGNGAPSAAPSSLNGQPYRAPPSYPPAHDLHGAGNGVARNGGQVLGGQAGPGSAAAPGSAPSSMHMYGAQRPPPTMAPPGQVGDDVMCW